MSDAPTSPAIAIEQTGSGPPVILVHGLGGTANVWQPQVQTLSASHRVVRFDLEGSGRSPAVGSLSIARWLANIETVMAQLDIARAAFVGHSLGTLIVQHFATTHPQRVERLALIGVNRAPEDARRQTVRDRATKVRQHGMLSIADAVLKAALSTQTQEQKPEVVACVRELLMRQDAEGYALSCEAVAESVGADLAKIQCPVLLVAGMQDTVSPPAVAQGMAAELRQATVVVLEGAGHWLTLEKPFEVTRLLQDFLGQRTQ